MITNVLIEWRPGPGDQWGEEGRRCQGHVARADANHASESDHGHDDGHEDGDYHEMIQELDEKKKVYRARLLVFDTEN